MWKKIMVVGTISVALLGGTALAVASTGTSVTPATSDATPEVDSHWSQMSDYMGEDWSDMVEYMTEVLGNRFGDMENLMESDDFDMDWSDMEEFMGGSGMDWSDMDEYMDGSGMGNFDMDWSGVQEFMNGSGMEDSDMGDVEGFMGGSGMGGSHMGGADTGGFMDVPGVNGPRSGINA